MKQWPTSWGSSKLKYWLRTPPPKAEPDITPATISIISDRPEPFAPPIGRTTPSYPFWASVVALPSASSAQPMGMGSPFEAAPRILHRANTERAMSSITGRSPPGEPKANGLVLRKGPRQPHLGIAGVELGKS